MASEGSTAVDNWDDAELLLGSTLFKLADSDVPTCTLNLEAEHIGALLDWWKVWLPV